jgi:hypothetical protein
MIVLFDDKIKTAVITSVNASQNYPPENIQSNSLHKRTQSSTDNDTLTITLADYSVISDFWYAFTTATKIILRLYYYDGTLLHTETINNPRADIDHVEFALIADVAYAELYYEGPVIGPYLGGAGFGVPIVFPDPLATWDETNGDNSIRSSNITGQSNQDYIRPLRNYEWTLPDVSSEGKTTLMDLYRGVGIGYPLWMDPFELNHDFCLPIYAKIKTFAPVKTGRMYNIKFSVEEAR